MFQLSQPSPLAIRLTSFYSSINQVSHSYLFNSTIHTHTHPLTTTLTPLQSTSLTTLQTLESSLSPPSSRALYTALRELLTSYHTIDTHSNVLAHLDCMAAEVVGEIRECLDGFLGGFGDGDGRDWGEVIKEAAEVETEVQDLLKGIKFKLVMSAMREEETSTPPLIVRGLDGASFLKVDGALKGEVANRDGKILEEKVLVGDLRMIGETSTPPFIVKSEWLRSKNLVESFESGEGGDEGAGLELRKVEERIVD